MLFDMLLTSCVKTEVARRFLEWDFKDLTMKELMMERLEYALSVESSAMDSISVS